MTTAPLLEIIQAPFVPLAPAAAAAAAEATALAADRSGHLDDTVVDAITAAGFVRHLVPRRWSGRAGSFAELADGLVEVGAACGSASWCAGVYAMLGRICSHLPDAGQREIWADGPDVRMVAAIVALPGARAEQDGDQWRVSGSWPFASGVEHAAWVLVGAPLPGAGPGGPPAFRFFAVRRDQVEVRDTWDNVGLRATASGTVVLDDVAVPAHRSLSFADLLAGQPVGSDAPCHTVPFKMVNGLAFIAPALGAATGALTSWIAYVAGKREVNGQPARDTPSVQLALTRASATLDAATLLVARAAHAADVFGTYPPEEQRQVLARTQRDFAAAAEMLRTVTDTLLTAGGARAQTTANPIQRAWRDVHAATGHVVLKIDANAAAYAATALAEPAV